MGLFIPLCIIYENIHCFDEIKAQFGSHIIKNISNIFKIYKKVTYLKYNKYINFSFTKIS